MLSAQLWNLDWSRHFPWRIPDSDVTVERVGYDEAMPFVRGRFAEIYGPIRNGRFGEVFDQETKERFYRLAGDFYLFRDGAGEPVGLAACNPQDWSTYYFRNIALLPGVHGQGLYPKFFGYLASVLGEHGVQRIEGDIGPANLPHILAVTKVGMYVTGMNVSERWGAILHFTLFLQDEAQDRFNGHFSEISRKLKKEDQR